MAPQRKLLLAAVALLAGSRAADVFAEAEATIDVYVNRPTVELSPVLYGLFFEDINYAADGGLYAELVENRSFEYFPVGGWNHARGRRMHPLYAWTKVERDGGAVELAVESDEPLNEKNTKYLRMKLGGKGFAGIRNSGFDGIVVRAGAKYDFSVYARRTGAAGEPLRVAIETPAGKVLAEAKIDGVSSDWAKHNIELTASDDADAATLSVTSAGGDE